MLKKIKDLHQFKWGGGAKIKQACVILTASCLSNTWRQSSNKIHGEKLPVVVEIIVHCFKYTNSFPKTTPCSLRLTCSGLRPIRMDRTLEKKLASSGLRGGSFWRKPYNFISNFSSSPSLSLIWLTSDVSSSHDMLGYLEENQHYS